MNSGEGNFVGVKGHIVFVLQIVLLLIPLEETDKSDLVMEVTAGVGGQEAMLFTAEMFNMYQQYAAFKNWNFEILEYAQSDIG